PPPPAAQPEAPLNNLPAQPTGIFGRDQDAAAVIALLLRPDVRLITLTGPGGGGKTRLAVHVAEQLLDRYPHGVAFVNLSSASWPDQVLPAIAQAIGVQERGGRSLLACVKEWLRERKLLLVLDTFDRLIDAAPLIGDLLAAAPHLDVIVTSRTVLRISAEYAVPVQPLPLPDLRRLPPPDQLALNPAVALFVERTRAVRPGFALTAENARDVAEICARLDGLPLAIELAAALTRVLYPPSALLAELSNRLDLLTGGARDREARQRALRDTIAWSYDLLDEDERALFTYLSVFDGGFTRAAAEEVVGGLYSASVGEARAGGGRDRLVTLARLMSLVDHSLLRQADHSGEVRFQMLATIRDFGLERLYDRGEAERLRRHHAAYFLRLAAEADAGLSGPEQGRWLQRLDLELFNLRAALSWAREQPAAEHALRLCATLQRFWYTRGYLSEGRRWTAHALTMVDQGLPLAEPRPADAPDAPQPAAMIGLHARVLNGGGALAWAQGDLAEAERFYARSLALRRELDDMVGVAATLNNLGAAAKSRGDDAQAIAYYEEALAIFRQLADRVNIARALSNLGWALVDQGDTRRARAVLEESLELRRQLGDTAGIATALKLLGDVAQHEEELAQAAALYEESLAMRWDLGDQEGVARSLEAMAQFAGVHGQPKRAARLWGAAEALRQAIGASLLPAERLAHERIVLAARQSFDPAEFDQAWAAGATMPLEQAVADARALRASRWGRITSPIPAGGTAQSRPPRRALRSPDGAHTIALDRLPLVIGRGQGCDVVIDDARVSRQHLRLSAPERAVVVTDLGSTNGTFVNGERVRERALRPGDTLSLGGLELVLVEGETNPAAR
ncbi:MAG TPA: tetratricopeptide repeat protein, partial [Roseiflexaceae bacterium]|nr:tetratricopeptide repeat protein [Roseiflexaceae bacterium]